MGASARADRSFLRDAAFIALVGLALRAGYLLAFASPPGGLGDAVEFHGLANALADGHGFVSPLSPGDVATAHKPPLYPVLLAAVAALGGRGYEAQQLAGAVTGTGTIVVIALIARYLAGRRAALIAAAIAALYPAFIVYDTSLHSESPYALLIALALLAALRMLEHPSRGRVAIVGALIALAALTRGEGVLLLLLLAAPLIIALHGDRAVRALIVVGVCAIVLAPWLVRCWVAFDRPVLISTSTGDLIAGANCRDAYSGSLTGEWAFSCVLGAKGRNEAVISDALRTRGTRYARNHRGRLPAVLRARALRPWGMYAPRQEVRLQAGASGGTTWMGWASVVGCWSAGALAVAGAIALQRRRARWQVLLAPIALTVVVSLTGYGILRFRAAADVPLVILAAIAVDVAIAGLRRRDRSQPVGISTA